MNWLKHYKFALNEKNYKNIINWVKENQGPYSFQPVFGDKERIVIPYVSPEMEDMKQQLEELGYKVDLQNGLVYKKIVTQQGEKLRSEKLGKALQKETLDKKIDPQYYDLYSKNQNANYSIILSRNPIDLIRMSDFKNIQSCHSEGGSYFQCALADAKGNSAIAYLVSNSQLKNIDLDAEEIFEDKKRDIKGITPEARLRLRKYVNIKDNYELALPEIRTYGNYKDNFYENVRDFLMEKQKPLFNGERPTVKEFTREGGSYQDNPSGKLFNAFFQDEKDDDHANSKYSGEEANLADQYDEEAGEIEREWRGKLKHFNIMYDIQEDDGHAWFSYSVGIGFEYDEDDFVNDTDNQSYDYKTESKIAKFVADMIDVYGNENVWFNKNIINISIDPEDENHPDDMRNAYRNLEEKDDNYEEYKEKFRRFLIQEGILKQNYIDTTISSLPQYNYFEIDDNDGIFEIESKNNDDVFRLVDKNLITEAEYLTKDSKYFTETGLINKFFNDDTDSKIINRMKEFVNMKYQSDRQSYFGFVNRENYNMSEMRMIDPTIIIDSNYRMRMSFRLLGIDSPEKLEFTIRFIEDLDIHLPAIMEQLRKEIYAFILKKVEAYKALYKNQEESVKTSQIFSLKKLKK